MVSTFFSFSQQHPSEFFVGYNDCNNTPTAHLMDNSIVELFNKQVITDNYGIDDICLNYFQGVTASVNLELAVQHLLKMINKRLLPILGVLVENAQCLDRVTRLYIEFLSSNGSPKSDFEENMSIERQVMESEAVHALWVCHMIDSWAYCNDCSQLCTDGVLRDYDLERVDQNFINMSNTIKHNNLSQSLSIKIDDAIHWLYRMCRTFALPHFQDTKFRLNAVKRYYCFLAILKSHPSMFSSIPRLADIMLVWMAHCLYPKIYRKDMKIMLGDSSIVLLQRVLVQLHSYSFCEINQIWEEMFHCHLMIPGTLHRPLLPTHLLKNTEGIQDILLKDFIVVTCRLRTENTTNNLYVDLNDDDDKLFPVIDNLLINVPCSFEFVTIRNKHFDTYDRILKYPVKAFLRIPYETRYSQIQLDSKSFISLTGETYNISLNERHYGLIPLPQILTTFLEIPENKTSELIVFTCPKKGCPISLHYLPEFTSVFMIVDNNNPAVLCKLVSSIFLPYRSQLMIDYPHTYPNCSTMIIYDSNGDQLSVVISGQQEEPVRMYPINNRIFTTEAVIELPLVEYVKHNDSMFLNVTMKHEGLHSKLMPLLFSCSLLMFMMNLKHNGYARNCGPNIVNLPQNNLIESVPLMNFMARSSSKLKF